ncbi:hypothetical protein [Tumebacillus lipolyticus]|uniref:Gram-positive cocci surface proteins LPxTG domain-containing protein n=1 Tax=Tumebacillus lipolyticus TaxID=1280370 RepID=A0ABW4ZY56_9BACL
MRSKRVKKFSLLIMTLLLAMMLAAGDRLAQASPPAPASAVNQLGTLSVDASPAELFAGSQQIGNLAPGDGASGAFTVQNTGADQVRVQVKHHLEGDLFQMFSPDGHPLEISYSIMLYNSLHLPIGTAIQVPPFSSDQVSPSFLLGPDHRAVITYEYRLPLAATNEYQGKQGRVELVVITSQVPDVPKPCEETNTCPKPPCEVTDTCPPLPCEVTDTCPKPPCEETNTCPPPRPCSDIPCPPADGNPTPKPDPGSNPDPKPDPKNDPPQKPTAPGLIEGGTSPQTGVPVVRMAMQGALLLVSGGLMIVWARKKRKK